MFKLTVPNNIFTVYTEEDPSDNTVPNTVLNEKGYGESTSSAFFQEQKNKTTWTSIILFPSYLQS